MEATFALTVRRACQWLCLWGLSVALCSLKEKMEKCYWPVLCTSPPLLENRWCRESTFLKSVSKHSCMNRDSVGGYQGTSPWDISVTSPALFPFLPSCEGCCQVTLALVTFENTRMPCLLPYFTGVFPHPIPDFLGKWKQQEKLVHSDLAQWENEGWKPKKEGIHV